MFALVLSLVSVATLAQDPSPLVSSVTAPTPPPQVFVSEPSHGVWIDSDPARDGRLWCRGDRYKMSFGADGAVYVPLFSSHTPQHYPLAFHLAGAAEVAPQRRGDGYVFLRGAIEERWELKPEGAEQSFVLKTRPVGDSLVIEVATVLPYVGADEKGLHFRAEGWGDVVYGHAIAIEGSGARSPLATTFVGGAIHIALPSDLTYPLLVDPFVSTIGVASNEAFDNRNPDVAYEANGNRWCVVMEERVSILDTDIKVRRFGVDGTLLDTDYFETSGAVADQPAVAAAGPANGLGSGSFCVTWRERSLDIMARTVISTNASPTGVFAVFDSVAVLGSFALRPDVGGSSNGQFLIVYTQENTSLPPRIGYGRLFGPNGHTLGSVLATTTGCVTPQVANAVGANQHWAITWNHQSTGCLGGDVHLAVLNTSLGVELQPTPIATSAFDDDRHVDVAWNGTQGIVVWDRDQGSHHDIFGQAFHRTAAGYSLLGGIRNLTALEPGVTLSADQTNPVVGTDGVRFVVAYMEGSTPKPICATYAILNNSIVCHEGHVPIATANLDHDNLGIASSGPLDGTSHYFVVTDERDGLNDYDIQGLFYDGRVPGAFFSTVNTGCLPLGASEAQLAVAGTSDLGHSFVVSMTGHRALPFVMAGLPQNPTTTLCTVLIQRQCRQGVAFPLLSLTFGTQLTVFVPRDPGLVGLPLAFQGVDVLATGACGPTLFGAAFAVTDTIVATIR
jgi:hypothetical protein